MKPLLVLAAFPVVLMGWASCSHSGTGTSVKALKRANGLKSDLIHINQKLTIPRSK